MERIVSWFSCGAASAVATKLLLAQRPDAEIAVARCYLPDEDADNDRFAEDCEAWFGRKIITMRSEEYASAEEVWERERYMSGVGGARCTVEMKKAPRHVFERYWQPDFQAFGYTVEERGRVKRFEAQNPEVRLLTPLITAGLNKDDCFAIVQRAGLVLPLRYRQGFDNANCKGCVNAEAPRYWNRERRLNPDVFERRAKLSRELGVRLVKLTSGTRDRIFLDELRPDDNSDNGAPMGDCSLLCALAEMEISQ